MNVRINVMVVIIEVGDSYNYMDDIDCTFWRLGPQLSVFLRSLEIIHELEHLYLGLLQARHVRELGALALPHHRVDQGELRLRHLSKWVGTAPHA